MADWVMVIITALYVVATVFICVFNARSAKAAKEQVDLAQKQMQEMINQYNAANRPIMTVYFDIIRSGLLCFVFENIGPLPAESVKISLNDDFVDALSDDKDKLRLRELGQSSLFLARGQKLTFFLGSQSDFKKISKIPAIITISYNSKYKEETVIDISQYAFALVYQSSEEDISQHIKKIKEQDKKFHKDLVKAVERLAR